MLPGIQFQTDFQKLTQTKDVRNQNLTITQLQRKFAVTTSKSFIKAEAMKTKAYLP